MYQFVELNIVKKAGWWQRRARQAKKYGDDDKPNCSGDERGSGGLHASKI